MAKSVYEAKKKLCSLGLAIERIHACKNNCVFFRGEYANFDKCPKCGSSRYKRKKDGGHNNAEDDDGNEPVRTKGKKGNRRGPVRIAWYFPIIFPLEMLV